MKSLAIFDKLLHWNEQPKEQRCKHDICDRTHYGFYLSQTLTILKEEFNQSQEGQNKSFQNFPNLFLFSLRKGIDK